MRHFRALVFLLGLVFSSSALADLKVYDVEDKYRQEVFRALRGVLSSERAERSGSAGGTVEMLPTGQILIDTTPQRHAEVAAIIQAINEHRAEAAPQVTLRYWAVLGSRGPEGTTPEILADVLDEIRSVHGQLSFRVLGNATLVSESGQSAELGGDPLTVSQETYVQDRTLNAELAIRFRYTVQTGQFNSSDGQGNPFTTMQREEQRVRLNTSMEPGEFVVVGENAIRRADFVEDELAGTIFYIVHWPAAE